MLTFVKSAIGVLLFACGSVFVLQGVFSVDPESLLGGVFAVAAGVYVLQRT